MLQSIHLPVVEVCINKKLIRDYIAPFRLLTLDKLVFKITGNIIFDGNDSLDGCYALGEYRFID